MNIIKVNQYTQKHVNNTFKGIVRNTKNKEAISYLKLKNFFLLRDWACKNGHIKILRRICGMRILLSFSSREMNYAAWQGHVNILKWGAQWNLLPNTWGMDAAARSYKYT